MSETPTPSDPPTAPTPSTAPTAPAPSTAPTPSTPAATGAPFALAMIGGGNMGAALVEGLLAGGAVAPEELVVVEASPDRRAALAGRFAGVAVVDTIVPCSTAVLAVKPPDVPAVAVEAVRAGATRLLSIAAGVTTAQLDAAVDGAVTGADAPADVTADVLVDAPPPVDADGASVAVVRAMPNTPALVGRGVAAICGGRSADESDLAWAEAILGSVGTCVRLDESDFDALTAVTGSGPAYVFFLAEALADAGVAAGLPPDLVGPLVSDLLVGSAALLERHGDPVALRAMVTSPGGTTAAGVAVLESRGVRETMAEVVAAAARRSREMASDAPTPPARRKNST